MTETKRGATRADLVAENERLRALLAQAGIDAEAQTMRQAARDAAHRYDITGRRAEVEAARVDARQAHAATSAATLDLANAELLVADLRASQAQLRAVLETVPVGILLAEAPSGRIVMGNRRVQEILGHPPIYSPTTDTYDAYVGFHADGRQVAAGEWPLARVVNGEDRAELEAQYHRPDGSRVWIMINGEAVKTEGVTVGAVIAFRSIEERKQAEEQQGVLNRELSHRLKNTLTLVQSIAAQTLRNAPNIDAAREALASRLVALGKAHDILLAGHADSASVADVAHGALALHDDGGNRFRLAGPTLLVGPSAALSLGLMLHELATNATKYGALTNGTGRVDLTWGVNVDGEVLEFGLIWAESGGPPVAPPTHKGFGSRLIERGLAGGTGGAVSLEYRPKGLVCTLTTPLAGFQATDRLER